jgi:hypothetical protein
MVVLVMLEETPEHSPVLAQVNSVPSPLSNERPSRDVVTLYGVPSAESLALALAAALESRRASVPEEHHPDAVRHLGVWPGRGAIGDTAWRDGSTGLLVTRDLEIPFAVRAGDPAARRRTPDARLARGNAACDHLLVCSGPCRNGSAE